jgi:hypothetical protein
MKKVFYLLLALFITTSCEQNLLTNEFTSNEFNLIDDYTTSQSEVLLNMNSLYNTVNKNSSGNNFLQEYINRNCPYSSLGMNKVTSIDYDIIESSAIESINNAENIDQFFIESNSQIEYILNGELSSNEKNVLIERIKFQRDLTLWAINNPSEVESTLSIKLINSDNNISFSFWRCFFNFSWTAMLGNIGGGAAVGSALPGVGTAAGAWIGCVKYLVVQALDCNEKRITNSRPELPTMKEPRGITGIGSTSTSTSNSNIMIIVDPNTNTITQVTKENQTTTNTKPTTKPRPIEKKISDIIPTGYDKNADPMRQISCNTNLSKEEINEILNLSYLKDLKEDQLREKLESAKAFPNHINQIINAKFHTLPSIGELRQYLRRQ